MRLFRSGKKKPAGGDRARESEKPRDKAAAPEPAKPEPQGLKWSEVPVDPPAAPAPSPEARKPQPEPPAPEPGPSDVAPDAQSDGASDGQSGDEPSYVIRRRQPRKRKCMVLWSGDIDSTYTLVKLLRESPHDVFAHHVTRKTRTPDGRQLSLLGKYETAAVRRMRPILAERFRAFGYSETAVDLSALPITTTQTVLELFFAAQAALSAGFTPDDLIFTSTNAEEEQPGNLTEEAHYRRSFDDLVNHRLLQSVMRNDRTPSLIKLPPPTREQQLKALTTEVVAMTVNCRDPKPIDEDRFAPCGACKPCQSLAAAALENTAPAPV